MFLLDTNVLSEIRKGRTGAADKNVIAWAVSIPPSSMFLSVISILELERGMLLVARRDPMQGTHLRAWLDGYVLPAFDGRMLPIDASVARRCAQLHVPDPRPDRDAFIAATALVHGMAVVTRNVADFSPMGVRIVDPWKS